MAKKLLDARERDYIAKYCTSKTDKEIAEHLGRDIRTIISHRRSIGITKTADGRIQRSEVPLGTPPATVAPNRMMTEDQRKEFFRIQLQNSVFYDNLLMQFSEAELNFYLEEWGSLCVQFEDIVATEKRQIDELIKAEIMGNRILRNVKIAEDEVLKIVDEVNALRKATTDIETNEEAQDRDEKLNTMIRAFYAQTQAMTNDYQKNVELRNKLLNELNARRRDRIDNIKKSGTTFIGIVASLRDRQIRDLQGQHMELVRLAKEKKKNEWRKPTLFPDGSKDCILLDSESTLPEDLEASKRAGVASYLVEKYIADNDKNILVVDDDTSRCQVFASLFGNHKVAFASNAEKATVLLSANYYDMVCLDYDLGLNTKGDQVVTFMKDNNNNQNAEVLVHSMNEGGVEILRQTLVGFRNFEVCKFYDIHKSLKEGEGNAKASSGGSEAASDRHDDERRTTEGDIQDDGAQSPVPA